MQPAECAEAPDRPAYHPAFLTCLEADQLLRWSLEGPVRWRREQFKMFGRQVQAPRSLAWYGEPGINYRYTGLDHPCAGWEQPLDVLRQRLVEFAATPFNFVLLNHYADGSEYMGWHRDDERGAGRLIASVSLGHARRFRYRASRGARAEALDLAHGSLLIFDGRVQHTLAPTRRAVGTRVNLTFRQIESAA